MPTLRSVQLFNEAVLRSAPTDSLPILLPAEPEAWPPQQVILDYKDQSCYGAMVHYPKTGLFAELRAGFNSRFAAIESASFRDDPTMGIWRNAELQFTIQLSEDDDTFMAIYVCFIDDETMVKKLGELLYEENPELFDVMLDAMKDMEVMDDDNDVENL